MFSSNSADPWRRRDTVHGVSRTLYQVLRETAARYGDAPALRQAKPGQPAYATCSWNDSRRAAEEIAAGLRRLGLAKGDTVALNSETRMEFYLADMGILAGGCIAAALYPSRSEEHTSELQSPCNLV